MFFFFLQLGDEVVEAIESAVPDAFEVADPRVDGLERVTVDAVPTVTSVHAHEHETDRSQHAEVLGHLRLAEAEPVDELADRGLSGAQGVEEVAPARFGHGVEGIGCRRRASHARHHIPISEYVNERAAVNGAFKVDRLATRSRAGATSAATPSPRSEAGTP
jgi:hypothetical protein